MKVAGIGLRKDATVESLRSAMKNADSGAVDAIATAADKANHTALVGLAQELRVPIIEIAESDLLAQNTSTRSAKVIEKRGTGSVAEASALAAGGTNAKLAGPRAVSDDRMATCAVAFGDD